MSIFQGFILGLLQGIAEFLPISSSGHLKVFQHLFDLDEVPILFDVLLHLASLLAVIIFFRKKIIVLLCSFGRLFVKKNKENISPEFVAQEKNSRSYILAIIIATIITGVLGIITSKLLDENLITLKSICVGFIVTAFLLIISSLLEKRQNRKNSINKDSDEEISYIPDEQKAPTILQSIIIGLAQGIGTLPGISRSGSTISGALFSKYNRQAAGDFSFIVSIPAILGAFILELKDLGNLNSTIGILPILVGCITAFISGYFALSLLMKIIKKGHLELFAIYLIPLGILGLIFF